MENFKTEIRFFSIPEWKKEEKNLREQHKKGWEYLQNYVGYSYFRKAASEMEKTEEGIFCDDASRLDMMKRVFTGRMIPLVVMFFSIIIPQIIMQSRVHTPFNYGLLVFFCVMFVVYLVMFIAFAIPYWKYYKSAHKK